MNPKIESEEPITMIDVKKRLDAIKKQDEELNFRAQKTYDYLNENVQIKTEKKAKEIYQKIEDLNIPRLKPMHIIKMIDTMPISSDELKSIISGYTLTITNDNLKKIISALDDFR